MFKKWICQNRNWVFQNFPFLENDFDALTDYELFCKMVEYAKSLAISNDKFVSELKTNLEEMYNEGKFDSFIEEIVNLQTTFTFNSVADMKSATNLVDGSFTRTSGYYSYNTGGGAYYKVRIKTNDDIIDDATIIELSSENLIAELIAPNEINPEIFGAYGDGINNDTNAFLKMFNYVLSKQTTTPYSYSIAPEMILANKYYINNIEIPNNLERFTINGKNKGYITNGGFIFNTTNGWQTTIRNITFKECNNPLLFNYRNMEYGKIIIEECMFLNCTGICLNIARRSHQVFIQKNKFAGNEKTGRFEDVDFLYFKNNWIENTTLWNDNHYDIEQIAINEGTAYIEENVFIPGYANQTSNSLYWIKIERNANITGNRFSGEYTTIYPIFIDYREFEDFTINKLLYPIINIINNPFIAGKTSIVLNKMCGILNIKNNSFTGSLPILKVIDDTIFNNLDFDKLTIDIQDNGSRNLNFKNGNWSSSTVPTVCPKSLNKFIKTSRYFAKNYNLNIETEYINNHSIDIKFNKRDYMSMQLPLLINGKSNPNPGGSNSYIYNFIVILKLRRYYNNGIILKPTIDIIGDNPDNLEFNVLINGQESLSVEGYPTDNIVININVTTNYSNPTAEFKSILPLEFIPGATDTNFQDYKINN